MKNLILSLLAAAALAGCSKNEPETTPGAGGLVPIQLSSGIEASTKAPITTSETVAIRGWEASAAVSYAGTPTWASTASVAVNATAASITLSPVQYYYSDNATKTYLKGWFPVGTFNAGAVTFTNTDGQTDAILSNEVSGSKKTPVATALTFEHMTAQLVFKVKSGLGMDASTKIKSIAVKNASVPTGFDLTKALSHADAVTWTKTSPLAVPTISEATITSTAVQAGLPVMIQPVDDNSTITLDVVTTVGSNDVTFTDVTFSTDQTKIEKGKSYTITLTFTQAGITPTASITPWADAAGSGTVI